MIEAVDTRPRALRRQHDAADVGALLARLDWVLLGAAAALVAYGLWAVAGITRHDVDGDPEYYVVRQGVFVAIGVVGLLAALFIDPEYYRRYKRVIYGATVGVMLLVLIAAPLTRGSKRWIDVGFFRFQPSEFGKLLFVLFLAGLLADHAKRIRERGTVLAAVGFASVPVLLVFVQPDIGTALVYVFALAGVLFFAGTPWTRLAALGAAAVLAALATWRYGLDWLRAFGPLARNANEETSFAVPHRLQQLGVPRVAALAAAGAAFAAGYAWLVREALRGRARLGLAAAFLLLTVPYLAPWYAAWLVPLAAAEDDEPAQWLALGICAYVLPQTIPV